MDRNAETASPPTAPRAIDDPGLRSAFGFDRDDEGWLAVAGRVDGEPELGRIGPYELLGEAGRGAQGRVYKAVQPGTGRTVALKRIGAGRFATTGMRVRFEREVRALGALGHPGIVSVFGADEIDGQRVLLMEWIDGTPIDRWARGRGLRGRLGAFVAVCDAVEHAHQRGVIHRDLKPTNILVDADDRPRVLDFGLAKLMEDEAVESGGPPPGAQTKTFVGTPAYAAPEQIRGGPGAVDTRTDVYALGAILYEMLTGVPPHARRDDLNAMFEAIVSADPPRPASIDRSLGAELDAIAMKALAKEPERRYPSVGALADDVRRYLAGDPVRAHPPSRVYRARKFIGRHRTAVGAGALVLLSLVAGAAAAGWQAYRATRAEAGAERERDAASAQARRAEAARAFLAEMLAFARPDQGAGPDPRVREMLDWATRRIESGALRDQPQVEADVCESLRDSYGALGLYEAAVPHAEIVMRQRLAGRGESDRESIGAMRQVAVYYAECGRNEEARVLLDRALVASRAAYGEGDELTMTCLMQLGNVLMRMRRTREAEPMHRTVLEWRRTRYGDDAWPTAQAGWELGAIYRDQGRYEEAAPLFERALHAARREFGPASPVVVRIAHSLARQIYLRMGRYDDSESLLRRTLEEAVPVLGDRHHEVLVARSSLANTAWWRGDLAEAAAAYPPLIEEARAAQPASLSAASLLVSYGQILLEMGRAAEAVGQMREAFDVRRAALGETDGLTLQARVRLGEALLEHGALIDAERELRGAMVDLERLFPRSHYRSIAAAALGTALAGQGRLPEAEPLADEAYRALADRRGPPREAATALRRLNTVRAALGKPPKPAPQRPAPGEDTPAGR